MIDTAKSQNLHDPIDLIRFLQEYIVTGRGLELTTCEEACEGATNFITVDKDRVLETTFSELEFIDNYRLTFKAGFMEEESVDQEDSRIEWIKLMNRQMKEKHFGNGLRQYLSKDYYYVGVMIAVALLQNGQMPAFYRRSCPINESDNASISEMQALQQLPMLVHLLRPDSQHKVNVPKLLLILKKEATHSAMKKKFISRL